MRRDQARRRTASATSSSSRRAPTSAAPGATTPTPAPPATSRASSTPSRSPASTGPTPTPRSPRSRPTSRRSPTSPARSTGSSSTPWSRTPHGTTRRSAGRCVRRAATWSAQFLIVGAGGLSAPKLPEIDGIETFQGELFHSAQWRHDVDLSGKRVAVIGTGASAIQIVPELQQTLAATGGHLDVYQRTAPWVIPRNDRPYGRLERTALRRVPGLQRLYRTGLYWAHEGYVPAFTLQPKLAAPARKVALANIRKGIKDPELRAKVTPALRLRLQAGAALQHLLPGPRRRQHRAGHRPDRQGDRQRDRHRRRHRARDRRAGRGDRLLHDRAPDHRARDRQVGADAGRALAEPRGWRPTRARRSPTSPTCSSSSAPTPAWATRA